MAGAHLAAEHAGTRKCERCHELLNAITSRSKRQMFWRPILVTKHQLDELEVRRYLDPNRRGERLDEAEAIEAFLTDALARTRRPPSGPT